MEHQPSEKFNKDAVLVEQADAEAVIDRAQLLAARDQHINRMQEIIDKEGGPTNSDQAELDYLEVELKSIDKELGVESSSVETETNQETVVLDQSDRIERTTIGGRKDPNAETLSHELPDDAKITSNNPNNLGGEYK